MMGFDGLQSNLTSFNMFVFTIVDIPQKTHNLLNSQPQSYHMQTEPLNNKYMIQHDITR